MTCASPAYLARCVSSTSGLVHPLELPVNESNAPVAAAAAGIGIIQTAHFIVRRHIQNGDLVPPLVESERPPLSIDVTYLPSRRHSSKVKAFIAWAGTLLAA